MALRITLYGFGEVMMRLVCAWGMVKQLITFHACVTTIQTFSYDRMQTKWYHLARLETRSKECYNGARVWVENPQLAMKVTGWDGGFTTPAPSSGQDPRVVIGLRMSFVTATRKTVNYA